jgi:hypothetical protein
LSLTSAKIQRKKKRKKNEKQNKTKKRKIKKKKKIYRGSGSTVLFWNQGTDGILADFKIRSVNRTESDTVLMFCPLSTSPLTRDGICGIAMIFE